MTGEEQEGNAARVRRAYAHLNAGELDALTAYIAADAVVNGVRLGYAGGRRAVEALRGAFPDLRVTLEEVLAVGERVVTRHTLRGTHRGALPLRSTSWGQIMS